MTKIIHRLMSFLLIINMMFYQSTPLQVMAQVDRTTYEIRIDIDGGINQGCGVGQFEYSTVDLDTNWFASGLTLGSDATAFISGITFEPDGFTVGSTIFTVIDIKFQGGDTTDVVDVCISGPVRNTAPVAVNDAYSTDEDIPLTIAAPGVLENDTDADGDALNAVWVSDPANGDLVLNADGSFTYTPDPDFNGTDTFTYKANDGTADSNIATVTITVNPVNDDPVANPDFYTMDEGTTLYVPAPGILANDTDTEGDPIRAYWWDPEQLLAVGVAELTSRGSLTFTPDPDFNGTVSFFYIITPEISFEPGDLAYVTITVNPVNDAPIANDDSYTTVMNTPLSLAAPGVISNDFDVDGDGLTSSIVDLPANGSVSLDDDGSFLYTPNTGFYGTDSFTYQVNDGLLDSNTATVTIDVLYQDQAPVAVDDSATTPVLTPVTVDVLANDLNPDGGPFTVDSISTPANGSAILNPDFTITYTPNAGFSGTDSLTYTLNGGSTATVTILVTTPPTPPVNLPPVANPLALTVAAGGSVTANVSGLDPEGIATIFALASAPASAAGAITIDPASGLFTYTHNGNAATSDSFTFTVNDYAYTTTGTVTITILQPTPPPAPINTAPVASDGSASTPFETQLNGKVVAADANGDPLTIRLGSNVANGLLVLNPDGTYSYTPNAGFSGTDNFTFIANDGTDDSNTATFTITVGEEVIVTPPETPLAALPMDLSWMYWLAGLLAALMNFLAFLRPNIKYTLITKDGTRKTLRRRVARPDSDIMFVELNDKDLQDIVNIEVMLYKRLAKHLDNVTVSFMLHNRIVHTVTIPEGQDEAYLTNIVL